MCAVKFLKLEDFLDDDRHGLALDLEPKGLLFAEVISYILLADKLITNLHILYIPNYFGCALYLYLILL